MGEFSNVQFSRYEIVSAVSVCLYICHMRVSISTITKGGGKPLLTIILLFS